jgi:membrane protease YdiL (CAAX protease family)
MAKRKCPRCKTELESTSAFCPKCGNRQKKKNIILFTLLMTLLFFLVLEIIFTIFGGVLMSTIERYKYGKDIIAELLLVVYMFIVLIVAGNGYIFKDKKIGFFRSLYLGLPMLIFSFIILVSSIASAYKDFNIGNFVNLLFLCGLVGVAEEYLCRGWLQNEFIERFGSTKKGIIASIIVSSIVFGIMHITNALLTTQGFVTTVFQILQAIASGFMFGVIYYRSKNIWTVAFMHGFFDFSVMLSEVNSLKDCIANESSPNYLLVGVIGSLVIAIFYIFSSLFAMSRKNGDKIVNPKSYTTLTIVSIVGVVLTPFLMVIPELVFPESNSQICYTYDDVKLKEDYDVITTNRNLFYFGNDIYEFKLYGSNGAYNEDIKVSIDDISVAIKFKDNIKDYIVINNEEYVDILVHTFGVESIIYHTRLDKNEFDNTIEYLNKIKDSFKEMDIPDLKGIGAIKIDNDETYYPYMITETHKEFYINKDKDLLLIK